MVAMSILRRQSAACLLSSATSCLTLMYSRMVGCSLQQQAAQRWVSHPPCRGRYTCKPAGRMPQQRHAKPATHASNFCDFSLCSDFSITVACFWVASIWESKLQLQWAKHDVRSIPQLLAAGSHEPAQRQRHQAHAAAAAVDTAMLVGSCCTTQATRELPHPLISAWRCASWPFSAAPAASTSVSRALVSFKACKHIADWL